MSPSLFRLATRSFRLMTGAILLWVGGLFLFIAGTELRREHRYQSAGQTADAVVTGKQLRPATEQTGTAYLISYAVGVRGGMPAQRTEEVPAALWEALEIGSEVRVQFLPEGPDTLRVAHEPEPLALLWGVCGLGGVLAPIGAWLGLAGARTTFRLWHVSRHGRTAEAVVTGLRETNLRINRVMQWAIEFEYRDHLGRVHRGDSGPLPPADAASCSIGDVGLVRFDPQHPERTVWMGPREITSRS